jgi:hypothetical protein
MNIPQVLGYTLFFNATATTDIYTVLLPLVAFAVFGSSRHLVVAADSATAAIFSSSLSHLAKPASEKYMALVGMVALLTAGFLLLDPRFKLTFLPDFLSRTVMSGFITGVGFQVGIAMLRRRVRCGGALASHAYSGSTGPAGPAGAQSSDVGIVSACGEQHPVWPSLCPAIAGRALCRCRDDCGER